MPPTDPDERALMAALSREPHRLLADLYQMMGRADDAAREERVKMTRLRQTIARRLKDAQNTAAMLTTFNEVDMTAVARRRDAVRREYQAREGKSLSYVAFVTKATVEALRGHPDLNAHWTDEGHWRRKAING